MLSLLKAEYKRLFKNVLFYVILVLIAAVSILNIESLNGFDLAEFFYGADEAFILNTEAIFAAPTLLAVLLIGREFSDRVIYNKVISGVERTHIYIAEYIIILSAALIYQLESYLVLALYCKLRLIGKAVALFESPIHIIVCAAVACFFIIAVFCAVYVFICMTIGSRVKSIVAVLLVCLLWASASTNISETVMPVSYMNSINDEFFPNFGEIYTSADDKAEQEEKSYEEVRKDFMEKNLQYQKKVEEMRGSVLSGIKKPVFMFLYYTTPFCQLTNVEEWLFVREITPNYIKYISIDILFSVILCVLGILIFKRKDL